jgi:hypothetical protein
MTHCVDLNGAIKKAEYEWRLNGAWCKFSRAGRGCSRPRRRGQLGTIHYRALLGLFVQAEGRLFGILRLTCALERLDRHFAGFEGDASALYGLELGKVLRRRPDPAFIADGSPVIVYKGKRIP